MADISTEIAAIQEASRGEAVRDSIVSGLTKMNNSIPTVDATPTSGSNNAVSSGGVYTALQNVQPQLTIDSEPTSGSNNPVSSGGVYNAFAATMLNIGNGGGSGSIELRSRANAQGDYSMALGNGTEAFGRGQFVFGEYNDYDLTGFNGSNDSRGEYVEIVGNGDGDVYSNARTLDWNGNQVLAGKLTVGAQAVNANDVPTLAQVQALIAAAINQSQGG